MNDLRKQLEGIAVSDSYKTGYWIKDMVTGEIISRDSGRQFNAASVIKLYFMMAALDQVAKGHLKLTDRYEVTEEEKVGGCGVIQVLSAGTMLSLKDLLSLMITISDNTATNMIFDIVGKEKLDAYVNNHGYKGTVTARKLMRVIPGLTNLTTPEDVGLLLNRLIEGKSVDKASKDLALELLNEQQINHKISHGLQLCNYCGGLVGEDSLCTACGQRDMEPEPVPFAHKTGEISTASHDAGIMTVGDRQVIIVHMMDQIKDAGKALEAHRQFGEVIYRYFK